MSCRSCHVECLDTACAIDAQWVVDGIGPGDVERGGVAGIDYTGVGEVRGVVGAVAESVWLVGGDAQGIGRISRGSGHVQVDIIGCVIARAVLGVEQGEAVPYEVSAVASVAALKGVNKRPHLAVHLPCGRSDVFQVSALIEGPVAPVAALLVIEH